MLPTSSTLRRTILQAPRWTFVTAKPHGTRLFAYQKLPLQPRRILTISTLPTARMNTLSRRYHQQSPLKIHSRLYSDKPPNAENLPSKVSGRIVPKKSLWARAKAEAIHYWVGTKLLVKEIRISTRLFWKMVKGFSLSRREHQQLVRTANDLIRLIPFLFFLLVPFMEFLLPFALKLFPNMLPSTYKDTKSEDEKQRVKMETKLRMAKFMRESINDASLQKSLDNDAPSVQEFARFFKKYRSGGERATTEEIVEVCKRFSDDTLTLDNLSRPQLVTLCRFMGVNTLGTDNILRFLLGRRMVEIKADDRMIMSEGVEALTVPELLAACQTRGIRTIDVYPDTLRFELQQWLDLHTRHDIPPTLLMLSRALMMTDKPIESPEESFEALQQTLTSLPDEIVQETEMRLTEEQGQASIEQRLELLEKEEARIASELAEDPTAADNQMSPSDDIHTPEMSEERHVGADPSIDVHAATDDKRNDPKDSNKNV